MTLLINKIEDIRKFVKFAQSQGRTIGLVPTMGSLHAGHVSLIQKANEMADYTIVSIYVNPTQFGANEDFLTYPRNLNFDMEICKKNEVDFIFAPTTTEMYGISETNSYMLNDNYLTYVTVPYSMTDMLCGKTRIGHFDGVTTIVSKLFNITSCDYAFFGQKDIQQLVVIKKMVKDLSLPVEIVPCPIVRDKSGLALSSRNTYLSDAGRKTASALSKTLNNAKSLYLNQRIIDFESVFETALTLLPETIELEYFECVDAETLERSHVIRPGTIIAIAARVENVRLIDNIIIDTAPQPQKEKKTEVKTLQNDT